MPEAEEEPFLVNQGEYCSNYGQATQTRRYKPDQRLVVGNLPL